jgi:hypothetical protein
VAVASVGFPLGGGGSIRTLGDVALAVWATGCAVGAAVFYRRARLISLGLLGALLAAFPGAVVGAAEATRAPWGIAAFSTVGLFVGLAAGVVFPASRRAWSTSRLFYAWAGALFVGALVFGQVALGAARRAPWNCAQLCHLPTIQVLLTIDALMLIAATAALGIRGGDRGVSRMDQVATPTSRPMP